MSTGTTKVRDLLLITGLALLLLIPAGFLRPPARQQELRVLISARNMADSGDWLRPEFQNQPRYRKPPLPYWLAAAAMLPDGLTDSAARARLPFALVALGALFSLYTLSGSRTPPLLLLASFGFWRFAPLAETDMVNTFGMILAMLGFQRKTGLLTALGMCLSILSKGPAGLVIPFITFLCMIRAEPRDVRWWLTALLPPLLVGGGWTGFLLNDPVARAAFQDEIRDTFLDSPNHRGVLFYFYTLPAMLGPALFLAFPRARPKFALTLPWVWFGVTFLLLSMTASKQNHYTLMLLPPAVWLLSDFAPRKGLTLRIALILCIGIGADLWRSRTHEDALHSRFLRSIRPLTEEAPTLFVVGINSARFDFHLGRHVHNRDSAALAFRQARPGDAVVVVQPRDRYDSVEILTPHDAGDDVWNRFLILRP
ncbi:MAG: hypothetical protein JJU05_14875 [Verrucomicrobia bacterium]|nr:hypothetical protein [Verrucomicrobiota bacterium]MCH8527871.1 hypothetical protein [Kiritimatiellia bacterium]